jgi:hypothetical protein
MKYIVFIPHWKLKKTIYVYVGYKKNMVCVIVILFKKIKNQSIYM